MKKPVTIEIPGKHLNITIFISFCFNANLIEILVFDLEQSGNIYVLCTYPL